MLVDVLGSLSVEDKLCFIGHSNDMILHGMTKESRMKKKQISTENLKKKKKMAFGQSTNTNYVHICTSHTTRFYTLIENAIIHLLWNLGYFVLIVILHIIMSALF